MASITHRATGWQAEIRRKGYKPVSRRFKRKEQAETWARQIESEIDRGAFVDRSRAEQTTLRALLERYRTEVTPRKRSTLPEISRLSRLIDHPLADRPLASVRSEDLARYRDERLTVVTGTSVNHELRLLGHAFEVARRDWGIHVDNPVRMLRRPKMNRPRERRLREGEEKKLIEAAGSYWLKQIIPFALETAMRRGELSRMQSRHVDIGRRVLVIPKTKNGTVREIPLSMRALQVLERVPKQPDGRVFPMEPDSITQAFERACFDAEIEGLRFHDLRHEATSRLFERGLSTMQVAAITGHKTLQMLTRYSHLRADDLVGLLG